MVKLLMKKQLLEIFRGYFYDAKRNRVRSKGTTAALIAMYVVLMVGVLGGMFTSLALGLCQPLCRAGLDWLYFTLFAIAGLFMGVFGSVFNTFSGLYQAKDNDLLLSLPIPVRAILASRLLGVYLMGLTFSAVILLPCVVVYWVEGTLSAATAVGGIALVLAVSLLTLLLSCLLGWVVAKLHSRLKRKNLIAVLSALVLFTVYYTVILRINRLIQELLLHLDEVGAALHRGAYPLYLMGRMAAGDWLAMAAVLAVTLLLCLLMYRVLDRTFISIATASGGVKAVYKEKVLKSSSAASALLRRELGRFTSSPNYMLNCGLGSVVLPALGVVLLVKYGTLRPLLEKMFGDEASSAVTALLCAALCLIGSMNDMSASSVSLEGKNLWLAQSLPVTPWQVLRAKVLVQVLVTGVPMAVTWVPVVLAVRPTAAGGLLLLVLPLLFVWLMAELGLALDLKRPNLVWTNEITVIKQRLTVLLAMLSGWVYACAMAGLYFIVGVRWGAAWYLLAWSAVTAVLCAGMRVWLRREGCRIFAAL